MRTPNAVKAVANLAGHGNVRITGPHGAYKLNADGSEEQVKSNDELEGIRQETAKRFAEMNASIANVLAVASNMMSLINSLESHFKLSVELYDNAAKMSADLDERIKEFNDVMHQPVVPVYNREGKLIAAKRVQKKK